MNIERLHSSSTMSQVVIHGDTIYLAGQISNGLTIKEQTAAVLAKIDKLLEEAKTDKNHIIMASIWLKNIDDFDAMNREWDKWLVNYDKPARACVQAELAYEHLLVEIAIIVARKDWTGDDATVLCL